MSHGSDPYQPPPNPYATGPEAAMPGPGKPPLRGPSQYVHPPTGLQYLYLFNFVFESPKWTQNLLFGTVCQFIPIIGPIVFLGHQYECIEQLHRQPHRVYPDFDFNNFVEYLKRGVWVFLVALVAGLPFGLAMGFMMVVAQVLAMVAFEGGNDVAAVFVGVGFGLILLLCFVVMILAQLVLMPLSLRAGLTQEFGAAFDFGFVRDFIRRVWLEVLLGQLFLMFAYTIVMFLGLALCCVGVYPAAAWGMLAHAHLEFQLYELYLQRGGTEIPLATDKPPVRPEMLGGVGG